MEHLEAFARKIHGLVTDMDVVVYGAIDETAVQLVQVNKETLLDGIGSDGLPLNDLNPTFKRPGTPTLYKPLKASLNPRAAGRYDMNFTGASFEAMKLQIQQKRYSIIGAGWAARYDQGQVEWAANLRGRVFGIFENDHLLYYKRQYLYPTISRRIKTYLGI